MRLPVLAAAALGLAAPGAAQSVNACDWVARPAHLVEPWEDHIRAHADGAIRIALLDTGEPACCSAHLLILAPSGPVDGPEYRACHVLSAGPPGTGFARLDFAGMTATYDPGRGLRLDLPVAYFTDGVDPPRPGRVVVRIDPATGAVTLD